MEQELIQVKKDMEENAKSEQQEIICNQTKKPCYRSYCDATPEHAESESCEWWKELKEHGKSEKLYSTKISFLHSEDAPTDMSTYSIHNI